MHDTDYLVVGAAAVTLVVSLLWIVWLTWLTW